MCDGGVPPGGEEANSCAEESLPLLEDIAEPSTLFGTGEAAATLPAADGAEPAVVIRKKKLPSARERNRNSGICLNIVQTNSSTSTNSSDDDEKSGKRQQDENIKEYKPLIEFVEDD